MCNLGFVSWGACAALAHLSYLPATRAPLSIRPQLVQRIQEEFPRLELLVLTDELNQMRTVHELARFYNSLRQRSGADGHCDGPGVVLIERTLQNNPAFLYLMEAHLAIHSPTELTRSPHAYFLSFRGAHVAEANYGLIEAAMERQLRNLIAATQVH